MLTFEERLQVALEVIKKFKAGNGIDWSDVETVFDAVKPLLEDKFLVRDYIRGLDALSED
jgi:hypothetical protein